MNRAADPLRRRIREALDRANTSPARASKEMGLGVNTMGDFLSGKTDVLKPKTCATVAAYFGWPVDMVLTWNGSRPEDRPPANPAVEVHGALLRAGYELAVRKLVMELLELHPPPPRSSSTAASDAPSAAPSSPADSGRSGDGTPGSPAVEPGPEC
jgi:hypothetical protein